MRNKIITLGCFVALLITTIVMTCNMASKLDESNDRVAALGQQNDELTEQISTITDAYEAEIASYTDANEALNEEIKGLQEEVDELNQEIEDLTEPEEEEEENTSDDVAVNESKNEDVDTYVEDTNTDTESEEVIISSITKDDGEVYIPPYYKDVTDDDIYWIQRVVETETYGADVMSKSHVASVVLNRIGAGSWGDSAQEVVTSPNQFVYFRTTISQSTIDAVNYVLENGDTAQGALYFHSGGYTATFCGRSCIFGDDVGHYFY